MTHPYRRSVDDLLCSVRARAKDSPELRPPAPPAAVARASAEIGFSLPPLLTRLLTEIGNGGFGPGSGILGIPPDGFDDRDLGFCTTEVRGPSAPTDLGSFALPRGLLKFCTWGCGAHTFIDAWSETERVLTVDPLDHALEFVLTSPSLADFLQDWLSLDDLYSAVFGPPEYRDGINPFTRKPMRFELRRPRGPQLDLRPREHRKGPG